jgi:hypothetical protein
MDIPGGEHIFPNNTQENTNMIQLFGVSLLSLLTLTLTLALHICHVLSPILNLVINLPLLLLWILGIALLGWNMAGTLGHVCNTANWGSDVGIMVCRIYKALFTFTLFGALSALAMVVLDIKVRKQQTSLGAYNQMRDSTYDEKQQQPERFSSGAVSREQDRPLAPWQSAEREHSDYNSPGLSRERIRSENFGYTPPSEQTHYDAGNYGYRDRH